MDNLPKRKSPPLRKYDYSKSGAYFITICTKDRKCLFSPVGADSIVKSNIVNNLCKDMVYTFRITE